MNTLTNTRGRNKRIWSLLNRGKDFNGPVSVGRLIVSKIANGYEKAFGRTSGQKKADFGRGGLRICWSLVWWVKGV